MIRFRMSRISVPQFAILCKSVSKAYKIGIKAELKHSPNGGAVAVDMTITFEENEKTCVILEVLCEFVIHPDDLKSITSDNKVSIPKEVIDYFISQTLGTARGIMHCKTDGTPFNGIIIPPTDVSHMLGKDMVIPLNDGEKS